MKARCAVDLQAVVNAGRYAPMSTLVFHTLHACHSRGVDTVRSTGPPAFAGISSQVRPSRRRPAAAFEERRTGAGAPGTPTSLSDCTRSPSTVTESLASGGAGAHVPHCLKKNGTAASWHAPGDGEPKRGALAEPPFLTRRRRSPSESLQSQRGHRAQQGLGREEADRRIDLSSGRHGTRTSASTLTPIQILGDQSSLSAI